MRLFFTLVLATSLLAQFPIGSGSADGGASSGANASLSGTVTNGATYFATDAPILYVGSGGSWRRFLLSGPLTPPPSTGWSWTNQGQATVSFTNGILVFKPPPNPLTENWRQYMRAAPATSVTAVLSIMTGSTNYAVAGLCVKNTSNGRFIWYGQGNSGYIEANRYTSITQFLSTISNASSQMPRGPLYIQVAYDATNVYGRVSANAGMTWVTMFTEALSNFLGTVNEMGVCGESLNDAPVELNVFSWVEN